MDLPPRGLLQPFKEEVKFKIKGQRRKELEINQNNRKGRVGSLHGTGKSLKISLQSRRLASLRKTVRPEAASWCEGSCASYVRNCAGVCSVGRVVQAGEQRIRLPGVGRAA
jgi:hypothetical protein